METFDWVSSGSITKFNKVVLELKAKNKQLVAQGKPEEPITEEVIKALYLVKGGLVIGDPSSQKGVEEGEIAFASLPEDEKAAIVAETKAKKGKK